MFPAILDLSELKVAVIGNGTAAVRRVRLLDKGGARRLLVFSPDPSAEMETVAAGRLERRLPCEADIEALHIVFTVELSQSEARCIAAWAREHGTLVNTEDVSRLCDFHVPAMVRRGDLLFTVSTGGRSPGLARRLRRELEMLFGPEWEARLGEVAEERNRWRAEKMPLNELARRTDMLIARKGWLP